jgi:hypothetical protein
LRIFSYIVATDAGFAPNPFYGFCTLACCKPKIRKSARPGDWVVGVTPAGRGPRGIVYAMKIDESIPFEGYWADPRFDLKKPKRTSNEIVERCGDNCYEPILGGQWRQLHCAHSRDDGSESEHQKQRDLSGVNVLVSKHFTYFGNQPYPLPDTLRFAFGGRGHKVNFTPDEVRLFAEFLIGLPVARARPHRWPSHDSSWKQGS